MAKAFSFPKRLALRRAGALADRERLPLSTAVAVWIAVSLALWAFVLGMLVWIF